MKTPETLSVSAEVNLISAIVARLSKKAMDALLTRMTGLGMVALVKTTGASRIDHGMKRTIAQSGAIFRYCARLAGLAGETAKEPWKDLSPAADVRRAFDAAVEFFLKHRRPCDVLVFFDGRDRTASSDMTLSLTVELGAVSR